MCLSLSGQTKDCGFGSGRETTTGAGAACPCVPPEAQEHPCLEQERHGCRQQSLSSSHLWCWEAEGAFPPLQPCEAPQCPCSSPKAPEQWLLSPLLRDRDGHRGIKGRRECRWRASGAQCRGGAREGGAGSAQAPRHSPFSTALHRWGAWRKQANQRPLHAPESRVPGGTGSQCGGCEHTFPFKTLVLRARA